MQHTARPEGTANPRFGAFLGGGDELKKIDHPQRRQENADALLAPVLPVLDSDGSQEWSTTKVILKSQNLAPSYSILPRPINLPIHLCLLLLLMLLLLPQLLLMLIIALMMQSHTIELLERIRNLAAGGRQTRIKRDTLHLTGGEIEALVLSVGLGLLATQVDRLRFFDVAEVDRVDPAALVRYDGRFRVAEERPRGGAEERVGFHVRCTCSGAETTELVFD